MYEGRTFERYPHVRKLLLERYYFELPEEVAQKLPADFVQKIKVKTEWKMQQDGMSAEVRYFDHPDGEERYYETFKALARRVANHIASGFMNIAPQYEGDEKDKAKVKKRLTPEKSAALARQYAKKFEKLIYELRFLPSSPFMFNAGRGAIDNPELLQLLYQDPEALSVEDWQKIAAIEDPAYGSCYAMGEVGDSIDEIFEMLRTQAEVFRHAGGFGANFSKLRSKYAWVSTIKGHSSGPLMFMRLFNENTYIIALHASTKRGIEVG